MNVVDVCASLALFAVGADHIIRAPDLGALLFDEFESREAGAIRGMSRRY